MKILSSLTLLLFVLSSCMSQKDYIAESDFNYAGNFKRYKTFGFVEHPFPDTTSYFTTIEKTITNRLGSQGFRMQDDKPDLLINYKIFKDEVKYRGYDQPNFDYWLQRRSIDVDLTEVIKEEDREKDEHYNKVKYTANNGMLVIYVIDNRRGNTVWQGYTAGHFDIYSPEIQSDLTRATYRVMDQFRLLTRN